jgi:uncharacterized membrane protein YdjX (TVP38/TMEM64 family)
MLFKLSLKPFIFLIILILFIIAIFILFQNQELLSFKFILQNYINFKKVISTQFLYYYLLFFLIYFSISVLSLPVAGLLSLLIGALFGFIPGILLTSFASSLGALVSFLIARYLLKSFIERKFSKALNKINKGIEENGLIYLFFVRMTPIFPFFLINLVFSVTKIKPLSFYWVSQLGMLFGTALFINAGTQISNINSTQDIFNKYVIISLILIAIMPILIKKIINFIKGKKNERVSQIK